MAKSLLTDLNFSQNEAQNLVMQNLASAPANPKAGQHYFNTANNTEYVFDGEKWVDALSQGDYTFTNGIQESSRTVSLKLNTTGSSGLTTFSADTDGLKINVTEASTSAKGIIEIATDSEASTGTAEDLAVNPKQLATKVTANTAITGATHTKITYDSKGLVTSGADITLSDVTDVTASAPEVNYLVGVTSGVQSQIDSKIGLTDLSIGSSSSDYLTYDNTTGVFGANVDTAVTESSTNLVTSGAVRSAINSALTGALIYQGTWTATGQTDYSSITLPVQKGYMYLVSGTATIGGVEWNSGDYLIINKDISSGGTITSADVDKVDNSESADLVRLDATQTLTNKTIDADDNTISDLTTSNFKSGVIVTTIGSTGSDSAIPTEQAVREAISDTKLVATNPALTASGGICTWTITAANSPDVSCTIRETTGGAEVLCDVTYGSGSITVKINSASNIAAGTYTAVVLG